MEHGSVITDLSIVIVCAAVVTVLFRALRLPVLLGYLLSGLLVGPNFLPHSPIKDLTTINELSELGVAFLMFYIGLEFDLKKLQRIFGPAFLAVGLQTVGMVFLGMLTAPLLGWSSINGLFLGCLLAISSTMVTLPILNAQNAMKSNFAQVAIGMLILEDILAILVLVVLTGVGVTGRFEWSKAWSVVFFVGVFVVVVYFTGKLLAPKLLNLLRKFGTPEMITVVAVASLLGIGALAETFNFSIALGAFLAGSILSQSELAHEIESAIEPLKNLFTAVFFVTIGMKIEPGLLADYWLSIVVLTLMVVVGKTLTVFIGLCLTGEKAKTAFKASVCKAQIGEFSFVIAGLGAQLHLTEAGVMTLAVGVALGSIAIVPGLSNNATSIFEYLERKTPRGVKAAAAVYNRFLLTLKEQLGKSAVIKLIKRPLIQIIGYFLLFNGVLIVAYMGVNYALTLPYLSEHYTAVQIGIWVLAAIVCSPFLIAIIRNLEVIVLLITESVFTSKTNKLFQRGSMRNLINTAILCLVLIFFGGIYLSTGAAFLPTGLAFIAFIGLTVALSIFFWRHIIRVNSRLEQLFIESLTTEMKLSKEERREKIMKAFAKKHPWGINLTDVEIQEGTIFCGKKISDLHLKEESRVTVVGITRDNFAVYDPGPEAPIFPGDHLLLLGDKEHIKNAKTILSKKSPEGEVVSVGKFEIDTVYLPTESGLIGSTLADSNIRKRYKVNVIGMQRGSKQILSPGPDEILKVGDLLVVVGRKDTIKAFKESMEANEKLA